MSPPVPVQFVWKNSPRGSIDSFIGVGTEIIALGLQEVCG